MKSLVRWSATLGLVGGTLLSSLFAGSLQALALTEQQILQKLQSVPVFTITDREGAPLVASPEAGQDGAPVAGVFISRQDAQNFLTNLQGQNPELARNVQVIPVSLAEVYELGRAGSQGGLEFAYVPTQQQVESAMSILRRSGQPVEEFAGVPLFIARSGQDGGYLTIQQNGQPLIPLFFKQEELQALLDRFRQQQPDVANNVTIQVVNLEGVIETMRSSNNPQLDQIMLVPPQDSLEFVRSLQSGQGQQRR